VSGVDPRLVAALTVQLDLWRAALAEGAERVGWKLGTGEGERIGPGPVIGHLTSATQMEPGAVYRAGDALDLRADAEVALHLGADVSPDADRETAAAAIAGYGPALELVDLGAPPPGDPERIVATNIWHRAFALGPLDHPPPPPEAKGRLVVNGETRDSAPISKDFAKLVQAAARLLGAVDERLEAGDRLITGGGGRTPRSRRPADNRLGRAGPDQAGRRGGRRAWPARPGGCYGFRR
jgi:2-keto-4-pentenoate hydratase